MIARNILKSTRLVALALALAASSTVPAQTYPTKPVRIIDAFAPGGTTDTLARLISAHVSADFGQPMVVENRTGANGVIGSELVANAPADGYTMMVGSTSTLAVNQALYKLKFDPLKDFAPVSLLAAQPLIVVVHPSVPVQSIAELIRHAKANPAAINYATPGIGNPVHLATELFRAQSGAPLTHVPYARGSAAAMPDLLSGQVQLMFAPTHVLPMVKDGRLRAIGVTGPKRLPQLPDVATVGETVKGFEVSLWNAAVVPAGTPPDVIRRLNGEIVRILNSPDIRKQMADRGLELLPSTPEEQQKFVAGEVRRWTDLIRVNNIKVE